jgi:hypothetical protein
VRCAPGALYRKRQAAEVSRRVSGAAVKARWRAGSRFRAPYSGYSPIRVDSNPKSTFVARAGRCLTPKERSNVRQQQAGKGSPAENQDLVRLIEEAERNETDGPTMSGAQRWWH